MNIWINPKITFLNKVLNFICFVFLPIDLLQISRVWEEERISIDGTFDVKNPENIVPVRSV